jgi:hypothetical protein
MGSKRPPDLTPSRFKPNMPRESRNSEEAEKDHLFPLARGGACVEGGPRHQTRLMKALPRRSNWYENWPEWLKSNRMYLTSNIPYFKCWVRKEFTNGHQKYHGEYVHALAVAVTTIPDRCLGFQVIFTGCEADDGSQPNVHGGAMWARMPITASGG